MSRPENSGSKVPSNPATTSGSSSPLNRRDDRGLQNLLRSWFDRLAAGVQRPASQVSADEHAAGAASQSSASDGRAESGKSLAADSADEGEESGGLIDNALLLSVARSAMACEFEVLLNQHQYDNGSEEAVDALNLIERMERLLSVYKPRSDLSTVNRFAHQRPIPVSADTLALLQLAKDLHELTSGAFDITAGSLSEAWGFSRRAGRMPRQEEIEAALQTVGTQHLHIDESASQVSLDKQGVAVNPGGIGKGYALDRAAGRLWQAGIHDFLMHGGLSSVVARGNRQHRQAGGGWLVALKHPWRWEETLGRIRLKNQALGTSGSGKQFFHFGGKRYSHIIDPRNGWPAEGMMSATVICPSGAVADALATAFFVMGCEAAEQFCRRHRSISAILIAANSRTGRAERHLFNVPSEMWLAE